MIFDYDLERSIIATMAHDGYSRDIFANILSQEHFYHPEFQVAYEKILNKHPIEADIRDSIPYNQEYYAYSLKEMHRRRVIKEKATRLLSCVDADDMSDIEAQIDTLQADILADRDNQPLTITEIEKIETEKGTFTKLEHGFDYLGFYDKAGSHKGQTEVIFGHPKHGKTVYSVHRCCEYLKKGYKGLYITLESTFVDIKNKFNTQLTGKPDFKDHIFIADRSTGAKDLHSIISMIKSTKIRHNIDFVAVDYIQRVSVKGLSPKEDVLKVMEVSNRLTDLANEYNLLLLLLAQPHRIDKMRRKWGAMPEVFDLYGSGAIEKDAFVATAVFRPIIMDDLVIRDKNGYIESVLDWTGNPQNKNSVFVCQKLNREAERVSSLLHLIHTDTGLQRSSGVPF